MILNSGLDAACQTDANNNLSSGIPYFGSWVRYAAFGTGSAAPDATDIALDAQVGARSGTNGGFSDTVRYGIDDNTNTIWYETDYTRVFNVSGNVNATEWGLAATTSGNLSVRELFRADPLDNNSSPITLTLEDGDQLQLIVTLRVQAAWEYETKSFVITGTAGNDTNGTHDGDATVTTGGATETRARGALQAVWPGGPGTSAGQLWLIMVDASSAQKGDPLSTTNASSYGGDMQAYAPGTYYRDTVYTVGTSNGNGNIYALNMGGTSSSVNTNNVSDGYRFIFTDPPFLTKQDTHRLTITSRRHISRL